MPWVQIRDTAEENDEKEPVRLKPVEARGGRATANATESKLTVFHHLSNETAKRFAIICAIDDYSHAKPEWESLTGAVQDGKTMKNVLKAIGYVVVDTLYDENLTRKTFTNALDTVIDKLGGYEAAKDAQVLIFFAGHGNLVRRENDSSCSLRRCTNRRIFPWNVQIPTCAKPL